MKHNDKSKLVGEYSIIRVFTSAYKFYEFRTKNLTAIKHWLCDKNIDRYINKDDYCCCDLYLFFKSKADYNKYAKELKELINYVPER